MKYDLKENYEMAYFTVYTFDASSVIILTIILGAITMELVSSLKLLYARYFKRNSNNGEENSNK